MRVAVIGGVVAAAAAASSSTTVASSTAASAATLGWGEGGQGVRVGKIKKKTEQCELDCSRFRSAHRPAPYLRVERVRRGAAL